MTRKSAIYALAVAVLMGTMAVSVMADDHGNYSYGPPDATMSNDVGTSGSQADAWDLREPMETGALPGQSVDTSDPSVCCGEIGEPAIESGGRLFRPDVDSGP